MININKELFRRLKPENKVHIINKLTNDELLNITQETLIRIVKEAGKGACGVKRSHDKTLLLRNTVSNDWNSQVVSIYTYKKKLFVCFYLQYYNTDTQISAIASSFFCRGGYCGEYGYEDRNGNTQYTSFAYNEDCKCKVIREILLAYIYNKYNV